ncbi:hypothetical protein CAL7716_057260 [Calothrix sp. PCC 7716]|nr:hypothetical protein CAL7716_057260 [Calothrix sp. PCC 7716]
MPTAKNPKEHSSAEPVQTEFVDNMTYQANLHIEKGKQHAHLLRGEREKTRGAKTWAEKQKVKADRQEVQLETQQVRLDEDKLKLQVAKDERDYMRAYVPMNRVELTQKLVTKAYKIGGNPNTMHSQVRGAIAPSTTEAVNFANAKVAETVDSRTK